MEGNVTAKDEYWIQEAIKKPGALRRTVKRRYGEKGFTERGTIKVSVLRDLSNEPGKTGQRARLALKLRKFNKKKKSKRKRKGKRKGGKRKAKRKTRKRRRRRR